MGGDTVTAAIEFERWGAPATTAAPPPAAPMAEAAPGALIFERWGGDSAKPKPGTADELQAETAAQFLKGIPIIGAGVDQAGAILSAAAHPLTGAGQKGETFGERKDANLKRIKEVAKEYETEHPILSTAIQLGGGVVSTLPVAATTIGARLLGLTGDTLAKQVGFGMLSGSGIGAVDSAVRGHDPATGALWGTAASAAGPVLGRTVGAAARGARSLIAERPLPVTGEFNIPLSKGQQTGDLVAIMDEQAALRGGAGERPQRVAKEFFDNQQQATENARSGIGADLGRGTVVAELSASRWRDCW